MFGKKGSSQTEILKYKDLEHEVAQAASFATAAYVLSDDVITLRDDVITLSDDPTHYSTPIHRLPAGMVCGIYSPMHADVRNFL